MRGGRSEVEGESNCGFQRGVLESLKSFDDYGGWYIDEWPKEGQAKCIRVGMGYLNAVKNSEISSRLSDVVLVAHGAYLRWTSIQSMSSISVFCTSSSLSSASPSCFKITSCSSASLYSRLKALAILWIVVVCHCVSHVHAAHSHRILTGLTFNL